MVRRIPRTARQWPVPSLLPSSSTLYVTSTRAHSFRPDPSLHRPHNYAQTLTDCRVSSSSAESRDFYTPARAEEARLPCNDITSG